jgi:hypothetical protein
MYPKFVGTAGVLLVLVAEAAEGREPLPLLDFEDDRLFPAAAGAAPPKRASRFDAALFL